MHGTIIVIKDNQKQEAAAKLTATVASPDWKRARLELRSGAAF